MPIEVLDSYRLRYLARKLITANKMPPVVRVNKNGDLYTVMVCEEDKEDRMFANPTAGAGTSGSLVLSTLKALSEYVERLAFYQQSDKIVSNGSTGFAAHPKIMSLSSVKQARTRAYYEAYERYVWPTWWDNSKFGANITDINTFPRFKNLVDQLLGSIKSQVKYKSIKLIFPTVEEEHYLVICCMFLRPQGVIVGGAAGRHKDKKSLITHAVVELVRHVITYVRAQHLKIQSQNIYERKLLLFASGKRDDEVTARLNQKSNEVITATNLVVDEKIRHDLDKYFYVHRCSLRNQFDLADNEDLLAY